MLSPDTSKKRRRERVSLFPPKKNRPNLGNRRLNVPAVYIMPNWDIASMFLRFQGAPILTLTRLFRLCFQYRVHNPAGSLIPTAGDYSASDHAWAKRDSGPQHISQLGLPAKHFRVYLAENPY